MKITRTIIVTAVNALLLPLTLGLFTTSNRNAVGLFDCCRESANGAYCCHGCCWITRDCNGPGDCNV